MHISQDIILLFKMASKMATRTQKNIIEKVFNCFPPITVR